MQRVYVSKNFKEQAKPAATIIEYTRDSLRKYMVAVIRLEFDGFISELLKLFSY